MKRWSLITAMLVLSAAQAQAQLQVQQTIRDVDLDPAVKVHAVEVVASQSITTTIRLPDSFEAQNVMCGHCIEVLPGQADATLAKMTQDARNWIIEKHPAERAIHVRPAKLPSRQNPPAAFESNIFVSLDGGHAVHLTLRLFSGYQGAQDGPLAADAVVNLRLPVEATLKGRLRAERQKIWESFRSEVDEEAHKLFVQRLFGEIRCKKVGWPRPHRTDRTILTLHQVCSRLGTPRTFWVMFEVENRSNADFLIDRVDLEPEAAVNAIHDSQPFYVEKTSLAFGEKTRGMALLSLEAGSRLPSSWRLRVSPDSADRQAATLDHIVF